MSYGRPSDRFTTVFYDHRCNGRSVGVPVSSMAYDNLTADADALRGALGLERWAVLGQSLGGHVALGEQVREVAVVAAGVLLLREREDPLPRGRVEAPWRDPGAVTVDEPGGAILLEAGASLLLRRHRDGLVHPCSMDKVAEQSARTKSLSNNTCWCSAGRPRENLQ